MSTLFFLGDIGFTKSGSLGEPGRDRGKSRKMGETLPGFPAILAARPKLYTPNGLLLRVLGMLQLSSS